MRSCAESRKRFHKNFQEGMHAGFDLLGKRVGSLAQRHAGRTAISDLEGDVTFAELFSRAAGVAGRLVDAGVGPGEPVAMFLKNGRRAVWASYGAVMAGAAETPLNTLLSRDEIAHCLRIAGIRRVVTDREGAALLDGIVTETHRVDEIAPAGLGGTGLPAVAEDAWGKIVFTSGTTGAPKESSTPMVGAGPPISCCARRSR